MPKLFGFELSKATKYSSLQRVSLKAIKVATRGIMVSMFKPIFEERMQLLMRCCGRQVRTASADVSVVLQHHPAATRDPAEGENRPRLREGHRILLRHARIPGRLEDHPVRDPVRMYGVVSMVVSIPSHFHVLAVALLAMVLEKI